MVSGGRFKSAELKLYERECGAQFEAKLIIGQAEGHNPIAR